MAANALGLAGLQCGWSNSPEDIHAVGHSVKMIDPDTSVVPADMVEFCASAYLVLVVLLLAGLAAWVTRAAV